jgi:hypothetical protein
MAETIKKMSPEGKAEKLGSIPAAEMQQLEGSLDTIKEILVGEYTREVHKRIDNLEERLTREAKNMQESTTRTLDLLESFMKGEMAVLRQDLSSEKSERTEAQKHAMSGLESAEKSWEKKATQAGEQTSERFREVRDQANNHFKSLSDEIARSQQAIRKELEAAIDELDARKTDRQFLSALLLRMSTALQKDSRNVSEPSGTSSIFDAKGVKKSA